MASSSHLNIPLSGRRISPHRLLNVRMRLALHVSGRFRGRLGVHISSSRHGVHISRSRLGIHVSSSRLGVHVSSSWLGVHVSGSRLSINKRGRRLRVNESLFSLRHGISLPGIDNLIFRQISPRPVLVDNISRHSSGVLIGVLLGGGVLDVSSSWFGVFGCALNENLFRSAVNVGSSDWLLIGIGLVLRGVLDISGGVGWWLVHIGSGWLGVDISGCGRLDVGTGVSLNGFGFIRHGDIRISLISRSGVFGLYHVRMGVLWGGVNSSGWWLFELKLLRGGLDPGLLRSSVVISSRGLVGTGKAGSGVFVLL